MTRALVALFVVLEALDFATFTRAPWLESNPAMAALPVWAVALAKVAGVAVVLVILRRRRPSFAVGVLGVGIAIAAFSLGTNVASLSWASRPAPVTAPAPPVGEGIEQGRSLPATPERTAVPSTPAGAAVSAPPPTTGTRSASVGPLPTAKPSAGTILGVASWYPASGMIAAAGPALRRELGPRWRGQLVRVCAGRCVTVTVSDWCQCHRGTRRERLVDLSDDAFARLAPLSAGLVRVRVR